MNQDFLKPYDHSQEEKIYHRWEGSGFFNPDKFLSRSLQKSKKDYFSIIMPPPNANGSLHVGHAVMIALEDILTRYFRLKGKRTLWLPGADHAGFETQVVFEKKLEKEGTSRFEILNQPQGKERLFQMIWDFTLNNKKHMEDQIRRLGASCDWSREKFTLDPEIVKIVYQTFEKLYKDGLIYKDKRMVNWCIKHQTTLSDLETKYEERKDPLYYVKYGPLTVATVRLETIFGDTALAVHPKDKRYQKFIGQELEVETLIGKRKIKVIADEIVDPHFGTGVVKVTPAHDPDDYEMWKRHKNEIAGPCQVIDQFGRLDLLRHFPGNKKAQKYHSLKISQAREIIANDMQSLGLIEKIDFDYKHNISLCYKCLTPLEPRILDQWFLDLSSPQAKKKLVLPALEAVKKGKIKIIPKFQEKIYFHWMKNIRDWNISRQIVWGIPIPVWYCQENEKNFVISQSQPNRCPFCKKCVMKKEEDVFDTWFSSGQWPFATLMAQKSKNGSDFKDFYPTSVMETGYDILFFWVARMIMLGLYVTGKVPFKVVYLHGLVRDKDKQKMSKSKGNVVDPLGVVEQYGADALRMALVVGNSPGQDVIYDENKIRGYRNFSNKLWNIARFVISSTESLLDQIISQKGNFWKNLSKLEKEDKKLLKEFQGIKKKVALEIEKFRFSQAAEIAYHYVWHRFADEIIEGKKKILSGDNEKERNSSALLLYFILYQSLIMLHPFMPFVTEAIYQRLPKKEKEFLMIEKW